MRFGLAISGAALSLAFYAQGQTLIVNEKSGASGPTFTVGGPPAAPYVLTVSTSGGPLPFTVTTTVSGPPGINWVRVSPSSGTASQAAPVDVAVTFEPQGISPRQPNGYVEYYFGNVRIASGAQAVDFVVGFGVNGNATLVFSPISINVTAVKGDPAPTRSIALSTIGAAAHRLRYYSSVATGNNQPWLSATPDSSTTPASMTLGLDHNSLATGLHGGAVSISDTSGPITPPIAVNLRVEDGLTVSQSSLTFNVQFGAPSVLSQTVSVGSTGGALAFSTAASGGFVGAQQSAANTNANVTVSVNPAGRGVGTHSGTVRVTSASGLSVKTIDVTLVVTEPQLTVSQASLRYDFRLGDTAPVTQGLNVGSIGGTVGFTAIASSAGGFLSAQQSSPTTSAIVTVTVNPTGVGLGTHTGGVRLQTPGGAIRDIEVIVQVTAPPLTASPGSLTFRFTRGGAPPPDQTIQITSSTPGVPFTASATVAWIRVTQSGAASPATVTVSVDPAGRPDGASNGAVNIATADGAPLGIAVTLQIATSPLTANPESVTVTHRIGDPPPAPRSITVTADQPGAAFTVTAPQSTWLEVSPLNGTSPGQITFRFNVENLAAGLLSTTVTLNRQGGGSVQVPVTCNVVAAGAALSASVARLEFAGEPRGTAPPAQTFTLDGLGRNVAFTAVAESEGSWLSVTPASGTTPSVETVRVSLANLLAGGHVGRLIFNVAGASPTIVEVRAKVGVIPEVADNAVVKALGSTPGPFAAGSLVTLFGRFPGLAMAVNSASTLPTALAGFTATAGGVATRPFFTSDAQVNLQLPFGLPLGRTTLIPAVNGVRGFPVNIEIVAAAPGLLTYPDGRRAIAQNQDYTLNARENPAPEGTVIVVYLTGQGDLNPPVATGAAAPADPLAIPRLEVRATIGGVPVRKVFGGMTPGFAGLMQGNFDTAGAPRGEQPIVVYINEVPSNAGMVYVGAN